MPAKLVDATELRSGSFVIIDGAPCVVRNIDISKTGKHGASKCRIEAIGIIDERKRVIVKPGHERMSVPIIDKRRGQILTMGDKASLMDMESYETLEVAYPSDLKSELKEGMQVEYWDVEGQNIIKRIVG